MWHTRLLFLLWHESYRLLIHYESTYHPLAHTLTLERTIASRIVWILACFRLNCVFTKQNEFLLFQFHESEANPFLFSFLNWFWLNVTCGLIKTKLVKKIIPSSVNFICQKKTRKRMLRKQIKLRSSNSICVDEECVFLESSFRDVIYDSLSLHT